MSDPFSYMSTRREDNILKRFLQHFDWTLFIAAVLLCICGLVMIYSACLRFGHPEYYLLKQMAAFFLGLLALFVLATVNYQIFNQHPRILMGLSLSLLVLVLLVGSTFHGTKAWLSFGVFSFQPAELAKLLTILILAAWCQRNRRQIQHLKGLVVPLLIVLAHIALILMQPDFGSTLVYFPILVAVLFAAGAQTIYLLSVIVLALISGFLIFLHTYLSLNPVFLQTHPVWNYIYEGLSLGKNFVVLQIVLVGIFAAIGWFFNDLRVRGAWGFSLAGYMLVLASSLSSAMFVDALKDYQRKRLMVFFNPRIDPMGAGYHVIQSMVALGSGKFFGRGLFSSTQGRLGFLPEQHTDFIFSVLGEELGFAFSAIVILLFVIIIWRAFQIAADTPDQFGSLVAVGIGTMFSFYMILNLAMVMGLAPVTGLPLPFISYGGSALFSSLAAIGILLSIHIRRYMN